LEGKTAIVTGASSGIGAATVRALREAGVRVAGGARRVERVEAHPGGARGGEQSDELASCHRRSAVHSPALRGNSIALR
jgi:NAD(P)-dependent dehydrogenase (short-subunit alcohol dehydrogenase family)